MNIGVIAAESSDPIGPMGANEESVSWRVASGRASTRVVHHDAGARALSYRALCEAGIHTFRASRCACE